MVSPCVKLSNAVETLKNILRKSVVWPRRYNYIQINELETIKCLWFNINSYCKYQSFIYQFQSKNKKQKQKTKANLFFIYISTKSDWSL